MQPLGGSIFALGTKKNIYPKQRIGSIEGYDVYMPLFCIFKPCVLLLSVFQQYQLIKSRGVAIQLSAAPS